MSARSVSNPLVRPAVWVALLLATAFALVAVDATTAGAVTTSKGKAWVRVAHLVPGLGAARIDLVPDDGGAAGSVPMAPDAGYGDVTTYRQMPPGVYQVQVRLADQAASAPMLSRTLTLTSDKAYTLAALGTQAAPRLVTLSDDLTPPAAGTARVRVLTASSRAPKVSVMALNGPTIVQDAVLGQASGYTSVPAGKWDLRTTAGSAPRIDTAVTVAGGSVYTLLVLDSGTRPRLELVTDAAGVVTVPKGGAQTGFGGAAVDSDSAPGLAPGAAGSVLVLMLGTVAAGLVLRRSASHRS